MTLSGGSWRLLHRCVCSRVWYVLDAVCVSVRKGKTSRFFCKAGHKSEVRQWKVLGRSWTAAQVLTWCWRSRCPRTGMPPLSSGDALIFLAALRGGSVMKGVYVKFGHVGPRLAHLEPWKVICFTGKCEFILPVQNNCVSIGSTLEMKITWCWMQSLVLQESSM